MKVKLFIIGLLCSSSIAYAQVGIGTTSPDASAVLDINSTNKGLLGPRVNLTSATMQLGSTANAAGLLVYNNGPTLATGYYVWSGIEWRSLNTSSTVNNTVRATTESVAIIGPLVATSDNGRAGYALSITTPDGKFSVRAFIVTGNAFSTTNLQIRNNSVANIDIISNGHYLWGGAGGYMQNQLRLPPGIWAGDNAFSSATLVDATVAPRFQSASTNPYWGDPETYAGGMPEQRLYTWTNNSGSDKVFYRLNFMMGTATPAVLGTAASCPGGICNTTKAYFTIDQISAP